MNKPTTKSFIPTWMKEGTTFLFHLKDEPGNLIHTAAKINYADNEVLMLLKDLL